MSLFYSCQYLDMNGFPVERPKSEYPYSYDPFRIYRRCYSCKDSAVDSDRMFEWDPEKFNQCCTEIWGNTGQNFTVRHPAEIERFLERYFGKRILLTGVMECCNMSNGYPYWTFYYRDYGPIKKEK